jgi:hypothetical protein
VGSVPYQQKTSHDYCVQSSRRAKLYQRRVIAFVTDQRYSRARNGREKFCRFLSGWSFFSPPTLLSALAYSFRTSLELFLVYRIRACSRSCLVTRTHEHCVRPLYRKQTSSQASLCERELGCRIDPACGAKVSKEWNFECGSLFLLFSFSARDGRVFF